MTERKRIEKPRCRFTGTSYSIWSRQCDNPAKGERSVNGVDGPKLASCGVHLNARYVSEYRPTSERYQPAVQTTKVIWR